MEKIVISSDLEITEIQYKMIYSILKNKKIFEKMKELFFDENWIEIILKHKHTLMSGEILDILLHDDFHLIYDKLYEKYKVNQIKKDAL